MWLVGVMTIKYSSRPSRKSQLNSPVAATQPLPPLLLLCAPIPLPPFPNKNPSRLVVCNRSCRCRQLCEAGPTRTRAAPGLREDRRKAQAVL